MSEWTDIVRLKESANGTIGHAEPTTEPSHARLQEPPETSGPSIPGYEILQEVGRGGMGVVYKARQLSLNRLVALKIIIGGSFAGQIEKARFRMEAEAVARLTHKHIVQVFDIGKHQEIEFIAFEFVDGPTVRRWQNGKPIEPKTTARIVTAVARAVQHAHDRGIIHRDLKPANILLAGVNVVETHQTPDELATKPDSRVAARIPKVMDFGLAKVIEGGSNLTITGIACGTPNYMAPEQVKGGPTASRPAVDVWGLGAVLFEMLTGHPPFRGEDAATIMQEILLSDPPSVRKSAPHVPRDLAVIVSKCLEKDPSRRYSSPGDVADDLDRFLANQPIRARPIGPVQHLKRWVHRNPIATALGLVMLLSLVAVSTLSVALKRLADREEAATQREREAREEEAPLRHEAEEATRAAEKARDETRSALNSVEKAKKTIEEERDRAEKNLAMARMVVNKVLATLSSQNQEQNPVLIPIYQQLLTGFEPFVARMLDQKKGDRELRFDQAFIARGRGLMAANSGQCKTAREQLLLAAERFRELVKDFPDDREARRELSSTLACIGSVSAELGSPDAMNSLKEAQNSLDEYLSHYPKDLVAIHSLIRVRLAMSSAHGSQNSEEHNRAVLALVERLSGLEPTSSHHKMLRAHALNNIASELTNSGKTKDAEKYWIEVLAIREELARTLPTDKVMRYELAKSLLNCANQLFLTDRKDVSFQFRVRAADLFDTLNEDAVYRPTYIFVMVKNDLALAGEYVNRNLPEKALARLNNAITLNSLLLGQDQTIPRTRADHADAHTRRAELHEQAGRHVDAAKDYQAAILYSTHTPHRDYCSARLVLAWARAGDHQRAIAEAQRLNADQFSHPFPCIELARAWLFISKAASDSTQISAEERGNVSTAAIENARKAVLIAEKKNWFRDPENAKKFFEQKEFEPFWDLIPRKSK